ncbi:hypothetical protein IMY05_007G0041300 [Salix suchowensis]|nr:hypothetical protein IMY05_007G0041300 [Salix suchowensis]
MGRVGVGIGPPDCEAEAAASAVAVAAISSDEIGGNVLSASPVSASDSKILEVLILIAYQRVLLLISS